MRAVTVDKATWMTKEDGFWVAFRIKSPKQGEELCRMMADGKERELTLRSKRRTLDANAYAWVLLDKLAEKLKIPPEEVYRQYIPSVAGVSEITLVRGDILDNVCEAWCRGHLGRKAVDMGPSRAVEGYHNVRFYLGSSDYDREQMGRLIDLIVQDCHEQGIETVTPAQREAMLERWGAHEIL